MNRIFLLGRLVRDPEVRVTPTERTVCTFTLAVDRPFTAKNGQREADFINIVTWNKTAELCGNSLLKGTKGPRGKDACRSVPMMTRTGTVIGSRKSSQIGLNSLKERVQVPRLFFKAARLPRAEMPRTKGAWKVLALPWVLTKKSHSDRREIHD